MRLIFRFLIVRESAYSDRIALVLNFVNRRDLKIIDDVMRDR